MTILRVLNPLGISRSLFKYSNRSIPRVLPQQTATNLRLLSARSLTPVYSFPQHRGYSTKLPNLKPDDPEVKSLAKPTPSTSSVSENPTKTSSVYTIPNILTFTRIISAPFIGYFIVNGNTHIALSLFSYSCITDFVDGYIARRFDMKSDLGSIIDPMADKFLMTVATLSLAYVNSIPAMVASIIIGRDVFLSVMTIFYAYKAVPAPKSFAKLLAVGRNGTISIHPNLLGKVNTGLQMLYIGGLVFKPVVESLLMADLSIYFQGMGVLVGSTTLLSGLSYVFSKNAVKILK